MEVITSVLGHALGDIWVNRFIKVSQTRRIVTE